MILLPLFLSSTGWPVGSSPGQRVFSKTPNRFVPVTGSRCGRRETGRQLGKVEARPTQRCRQHPSETSDTHLCVNRASTCREMQGTFVDGGSELGRGGRSTEEHVSTQLDRRPKKKWPYFLLILLCDEIEFSCSRSQCLLRILKAPRWIKTAWGFVKVTSDQLEVR